MMQFGDADTPVPRDHQILIKVKATSVNGPDLVQRQGNYSPPKGESEILGLEVAGIVEALGEKVGECVNQWKVGDRVMALIPGGGYAQFAVAHYDHAITIPDDYDFIQAACVCETYLTAYLNVFKLGGLQNNQWALLHGGGGGVNTAAIQLCKNLTPDTRIIVTASSKKIERVKSLGADFVIDYKKKDFAERVREITEKIGVNVILDHIGGSYFSSNMKCLSVGGALIIIGINGGPKAEINLALAMVKRQKIIGSVLRARSILEKATLISEFAAQVLPFMSCNKITPIISEVFPLEYAATAHRLMEESAHFGKIVLTTDS